MNTGLLVLRLVLGLLLVGHGSQKLFGWLGGPGLAGTGGFFHSLGFRPGKPMAIVAGVSEAGAGALLALGLFTERAYCRFLCPLGGVLAALDRFICSTGCAAAPNAAARAGCARRRARFARSRSPGRS